MQQGGGGSSQSQSQSQSQYGVVQAPADITPPSTATLTTTHMLLGAADQSQHHHHHQQIVEEASPISSRPPAAPTIGGSSNLDEFMRLTAGGSGADEDVGEEADRAGGLASGNRWPRQETVALIQIRSDMDALFRDATLKGPLWEDVSRKLAELGYKRSAKKCKEKFENVHKYYKRTKEGRAGRQDGKSYKFFSQLEALHNTTAAGGGASPNINLSAAPSHQPPPTTTTTSSLDIAPVSVGIPMPISSSVRRPPPQPQPPSSNIGLSSSSMFPPDLGATMPTAAALVAGTSAGISLSSNESSSSPSSEEDDDYDELEARPSSMAAGSSRKRKRRQSTLGKGDTRRMMEFFEGLMKQVMQKQETMQQRFLEAIEKREQDRMIREEAWKRQEMTRLSREHELKAQERAISASRDAAIVAFLQKITGQTIQLPTIPAAVQQSQPPAAAQPQPQPPPIITATTQSQTQPQPPPPPQQQQQQPQPSQPPPPTIQQEDKQQQKHHQVPHHHHQHQHQSPISSDVLIAIPEQSIPPPHDMGSGGSLEPTSSRWPKAEVLALIKLRSGLESRYQEAVPKGPLWEEISAGMQRMGYKRNAKRCKEKWENINKYYKKVKESNKKRPEDAKTCPYFHQLDALHRKKIIGSSSGGGGSTSTSGFAPENRPEQQQQQQQQEGMKVDPLPPATHLTQASESQNKNAGGADVQAGLPGGLFGQGNGGASKKPEDIVKELIKQQGTQHHEQQGQQLLVDDYDDKIEEPDSDNMDHHEDDEDEDEDDGDGDGDEDDEVEELQEKRKMAYKIEFQRQNTNASNGGGNGAPSFLAMVQ